MITVFLKKFDSSYSDTVEVHHISEIINGKTLLVPLDTPHFLLYVTEKHAKYYVHPHGNFAYMFNGVYTWNPRHVGRYRTSNRIVFIDTRRTVLNQKVFDEALATIEERWTEKE